MLIFHKASNKHLESIHSFQIIIGIFRFVLLMNNFYGSFQNSKSVNKFCIAEDPNPSNCNLPTTIQSWSKILNCSTGAVQWLILCPDSSFLPKLEYMKTIFHAGDNKVIKQEDAKPFSKKMDVEGRKHTDCITVALLPRSSKSTIRTDLASHLLWPCLPARA